MIAATKSARLLKNASEPIPIISMRYEVVPLSALNPRRRLASKGSLWRVCHDQDQEVFGHYLMLSTHSAMLYGCGYLFLPPPQKKKKKQLAACFHRDRLLYDIVKYLNSKTLYIIIRLQQPEERFPEDVIDLQHESLIIQIRKVAQVAVQ